ncbi:hypothetical protein L6452_22735 [Arctium lappa]|uniref:Uncharacterized protein n=1 Tax=Arctium lappa TaxID=4217 RepID=A0ACB9B1E8_ARCLA|nr:hypothetical protein L6452_22735 [Arctium lappa]
MHMINAVQIIRTVMSSSSNSMLGAEIEFGSAKFYLYAGISCSLVIFAGIMSGLTLGLMSLGLVELEILQSSGTPTEKKQAGLISRWLGLREVFGFSKQKSDFGSELLCIEFDVNDFPGKHKKLLLIFLT